jgi:citrate lyase beta subunit
MTKLRRSLLFVPGNKPDLGVKATKLPTDVVVVDLEDGVSPDDKNRARLQAEKMLEELDFGNREVALRVNRINTLNGLSDILALVGWRRKPDIIIIPKVESAGEVQIYYDLLKEMNAPCQLFPVVESTRGLQAIQAIMNASARITTLSFGIADLSAELNCRIAWEPFLFFRSAVVAAGALAGAQVIDPPFLNIKDETGLVEECKKARDMGFSGKICIHPSQLEPVNKVFTPTSGEVERAQKVVKAAETCGGGPIAVDGRMVDVAVVKAAKRVLAIVDHLGTKKDS